MKGAAHKRLGSITVLSLLALLALAIGAQTAFAGQSSAPAAGTQGRGGVSAAGFAVSTPAAGTQGRGGVAPASVSAVVVTTPAAGTQGRGGVAGVSGPATSARAAAPTSGGPAFAIRGRGRVPRAFPGTAAVPGSVATTSNSGAWLAAGIAAAVLLVSIVAWASYRRRGERGESSLAAFCVQHPEDAACRPA
jgi:hypothetical protein